MVGGPGEMAAVVLDCLEWLFPCPAEVATAEGARRPSESRGWSPLSHLRDVCYCGPVRLSWLLYMSSEEAFSLSRGL